MKFLRASYPLILMAMLSGCAYHSRFTDQSLQQRFLANEGDFKKVIQMLSEDPKLCSISREAALLASDVKADLPQPRLNEYRSILSKLNVSRVTRRPTGQVYFAIWNKDDFIMGGSNEYFVYAESDPAEKKYLVESLDDLRKQTDAFAYKRIAGHWYLFVDNW